MTKDIWINLPVKEVKKSKAFFNAIGFKSNPSHPDSDQMASLMIGQKNVILMICQEDVFKGFVSNKVSDAQQATEVLFSIDAESREEVDEMAKKVKQAGGKIYGEPGENQGWMYGFGFVDLDGHRWNMLYMDFSKMPK